LRLVIPLVTALTVAVTPNGHAQDRRSAPTLPTNARLDVPPVAKTVTKLFTEFGHQRFDNYDWLRNEDDPDVMAYLKAENTYAVARLARISPLIEELRRGTA
jgi:oligopeptidase B